MPPKAIYHADYKNKSSLKGTVIFGDLPEPPADYPDNIGVTLAVTEKQAEKFKAFIKGPVAEWTRKHNKKPANLEGLSVVEEVNKDGEPTGNYKIKLSRRTFIGDKRQRVVIFDADGMSPLDLEGNLTRGSVVQVQFYLYLSKTSKGVYGRAEPTAVRVLELAEGFSPDVDWEDDDDEAPEVAGWDEDEDEVDSNGSSENDDEEML